MRRGEQDANGGSSEPVQAEAGRGQAEEGVALQDSSVLAMVSADRQQYAAYYLEFAWPAGVPKPAGVLRLSAGAVLASGMRVELGKTVELPKAQPAAYAALSREAVAAGQPGSGERNEGMQWGERWAQEFGVPALQRLLPLLHHGCRAALASAGAPPPGGLLICGPAGSGARATSFHLTRCLTSASAARACNAVSQESASVQLLVHPRFSEGHYCATIGVPGKSGLARMVAAALGRHHLCRTHVVWVDCCAIPTDTLANARAALARHVRALPGRHA